MRNTSEDWVRDDILDILARAEVEHSDPVTYVEKYISTRNKRNRALVLGILRYGFASLRSDKRFWDRLQIKVLRLNPEHYNAIAQRRQAHESLPEVARRRAEYQEKKAADAAGHREFMEFASTLVADMTSKLNIAMEFYDKWTLSSGKNLGDATAADLRDEADRERSMASGHSKNAKFYSQLASIVPQGKTVREAVPLERAHKIRESIYSAQPAMLDSR